MPDYSHWSHWFPTHRGLTASQFDERAVLLARTLERMGLDRPHQIRTNTDPNRQFKAALSAVFDRWTSRRRIEARSGLRAALDADDQHTITALSRRADTALLARAREARRGPTRKPVHRMP